MTSEFKTVFDSEALSAKLFAFLRVVYHLYPEDKFYQLIAKATRSNNTDEDIYKKIQAGLPGIKPFLSELTYSLPALKKQKKEICNQTLRLLQGRKNINGYLEIGTTGRYISRLRKEVQVTGNIFLMNDIAPSNSVADIFERGQFKQIGQFIPLDYKHISPSIIADESLDVVTCYIGLHHCPLEDLNSFISSIKRVLRKGGLFIIRDHDVKTSDMAIFVSVVHTVFNAGLTVPWETESKEFKSLKSIDEWVSIIGPNGFKDTGARILQDNDPSDNTLISFIKM